MLHPLMSWTYSSGGCRLASILAAVEVGAVGVRVEEAEAVEEEGGLDGR